ncbi:MAG: hypothetical protein ABUL60_05680 [Myxococcales bacterium]
MKRLSELPAEDGLTARAQVLIRAIGPTLESEERRRRVRRSLDARPASPRWLGRAALVLGLLGASAAAAAAGGSALSRVFGTQAPPDETLHAAPTVRKPPPTRAAPALPDPGLAAPALPSTPPIGLAPTPAGTSLRPPVPRPSALSDVARVHEAAKALRHDADPERALQLLERGAPVTGPLAEEALALRIEASRSRGDGRQAKLAAAYLAQYPNGRYRELAKQALSSKKP